MKKAKTMKKKTLAKGKTKPRKKAAVGPLGAYVLIDRSGSMASQWSEAVSSVNAYVKGLKDTKTNAEITLAVFDHHGGVQFDVLRDKVKTSEWHDVGTLEVTPRGSTPLYDAVGMLAKRAVDANRKRSVIVIMTDGEENCSREMTRESATAILDKCKAKDWQVIFLGANFDAAGQASALNIAGGVTLSSILPQNLAVSMRTVADYTSNYAGRGTAMAFTDADRKRATSTSS